MSIRSRGFVAAMEDDTPEVEININPEVPAEVEEQTAQVAEDAAAIQDETQAMEDAVADAETLDMIADTAEQSVEEGEGMDPVAAEIAEVAVESIYSRLGITRKAMPSMESFGSAGSRKSATRIAVEDWKETVKKVWEAVKKFFVGLWEKLKAFFSNVLNSFRSLDKAAKAMKARIDGVTGEMKEKTFKNKALAKGLGRATASKLTASVATETIQFMDGVVNLMKDSFNSADVALNQIKNVSSTSAALTKEVSEKKTQKAVKDAVNHLSQSTKKGEPLYDGVQLVVKDSLKKGEFTFEFKTEEKESSAEEVEVLTKAQMSVICDEVVKLSKSVEQSQKDLDKFAQMNKSVFSIVDNITKLASENTENADHKTLIATMRESVITVGSSVNKAAVTVLSLSNKTGRASLKYVAESMKQYGEKKEEKKED